MESLNLGLKNNGSKFALPTDAAVQTFAIVAIRGAGKTSLATVMAEEMCKAALPWICFDPVGVWWGMRATSDGKPSPYPVVVIGGEHGDLPLERTSGAKLAEAIVSENVFVVIDVSQESKRFWHTFLADFSLSLMKFRPEFPRHLFIEEAPEFVPQRTRVDLTARCKEAIERLIRLGRNHGYGCTLISQRPATVDKDVLSQCENLFVMRTIGAHDRKALREWIETKDPLTIATDDFLNEISSLPNGTAFFWSPHWLKMFERVRIRERETFHPGATRVVGTAQKAAALSDVGQFVDRLKKQLTKTSVPPSGQSTTSLAKGKILLDKKEIWDEPHTYTPNRIAKTKEGQEYYRYDPNVIEAQGEEIARLQAEIVLLKTKLRGAESRLDLVRKSLDPQYQALRGLFETLGDGKAAGSVDRTAYEPWLAKAGRAGARRLLETILDRQELTRTQLATLSGLGPGTGTFRNYLSWLRRNGLVETDGETVRLRQL